MKKYELIVAIVNHGFEEEVMSAARSAGARGGTVFNARGTANEEDELKFLGMSLHPHKEVVFIVTDTDSKLDIMRAIKDRAGITTPGSGVLFTLPVESVMGIDY